MTRIVFDISGHGYGHMAQSLPVIRELLAVGEASGGCELLIRCRHSVALLEYWLQEPEGRWRLLPPPEEAEIAMLGPADIDVPATEAAFEALHRDFEAVLAREAGVLQALRADFLLSNVGYTGLAAAARIGLPAAALSSLDWVSIYAVCCAGLPGTGKIIEDMKAAYQSARFFIQLQPHLPMGWLGGKRRSAGPIGRMGQSRRAELCQACGIPEGKKLILMSFGGIEGGERLLEGIPTLDNVVWLLGAIHFERQKAQQPDRSDLYNYDLPGLPFVDLLASVDLVVSKTGYGMYVETALNGAPLLTLERENWPEEPWLQAWAGVNGLLGVLPPEGRGLSDFTAAVTEMLARIDDPDCQRPPRPVAGGVADCLAILAAETGLVRIAA